MLNKIIHFSLYNRMVVLILAAIILLGGCYALTRAEVDIFPDLNAPTVVVMTEAPGMAPEEVERLVTFPIETAVNGSTGVRRVRSSSAAGFSAVWVEFDWGTDVYRARQTVSEKLATIAETLPPGAKSPTLGPQSSILGEVMIIGLTPTSESLSLRELRTIADKQVRPRLLGIGGVSQVSVIGGELREFQILLSPERMRHLGVTLDEALAAANEVNDNASGGVLYEYGNEYIVKAPVNTSNAEEIGRAVVRSEQGKAPITLTDIAEVREGSKSPALGVASVEAEPAVIMTVTKQPGVGTVQLTERLEEALQSEALTLPKDIKISSHIFRQSDFIDTSISNLQGSLLEGALMVIVVLFFFLMNLRTTLISIIALPMSIIISVIVLKLLNFSINTMSLGGIAIAIGSLVDDAIVDVENVYKHLRRNRQLPPQERKPTLEVIYAASKEVRMPIFNSTLIIIAGFLPLFFLSGMEGRMLIPLGIAFIVALFASTVVALTLTPVLCSYLLGSKKADQAESREPWAARKLKAAYEKGLQACLRHKKITLWSVSWAFVVACVLFFTLGRSFLPSFNEGSMTINVSTLPGISLAESDKVGRLAEQIIMETPEVRTVARKTGRAELDEHSLGVNVSEIEAPYTLRDRSRAEMVADLRHRLKEIPGVNIEIGQPISHRIDAMLSGTEAQIAIKIFGDDLNALYAAGNEVKRAAQATRGVTDVNIEQQIERPELEIRPRRDMLSRYGIRLADFVDFVDVALAGKVVSQVYEQGLPYDITVKFSDASRSSIEAVKEMLIDSNVGKIPLANVADVVSSTGPNTINRENVKRRLVVSANVEGRDLRGTVNEIQQRVADMVELPEGYSITYGGQFESEATASRVLALTSVLAFLIIFSLLYIEFRNIGKCFIILVNMPLAAIGGVLILVCTGSELNIPAIIGFISLLGIATRNGMLLISRYTAMVRQGIPLEERIAVGSRDRLLPIVMTALTSALALIPLALRGTEPGNEIQAPLAIVILGGLVSSTFLNIFVVPVLYKLLSQHMSHPNAPFNATGLGKSATKATAVLLLLCLTTALCATAQKRTDATPFENAVNAVLSGNPELQALQQNGIAETEAARAENVLENPEAEFQRLWGRTDNRWNLSVSQGFDWPGAYAVRKRIAEDIKVATEAEYEARETDLRTEARQKLAALVGAKTRRRVLREVADNMQTLLQRFEQSFRHGEASILDVNKLKIEVVNAHADLVVVENEISSIYAALSAMSAENADAMVLVDMVEDYPPVKMETLEDYLSVVDTDPHIRATAARQRAAQQGVKLERRLTWPGITAGYAHAFEDGEHFNGFTIGLTLPVYNRKARRAQGRALQEAARWDQIAQFAQHRAMIRTDFARAQSLKGRLDDFGPVVENADNLRLVRKAFDGGQLTLLQYLQETDYFLRATLTYHQLRQEYVDLLISLSLGQ